MNPVFDQLRQFNPQAYESALEALGEGKAVRQVQLKTEAGRIQAKGLVEGNFCYHYSVSVGMDFHAGPAPVLHTSCGCYQRRRSLLCEHCAMLMIRGLEENPWEPEVVEIPQEPEQIDIPEEVEQTKVPEEPEDTDQQETEDLVPVLRDEEEITEEPDNDMEQREEPMEEEEPEEEDDPEDEEPAFTGPARSMNILLGTDMETGEPVYWHPNDTEAILNPNTGIIGTMGTGKTQITKSLVAQLHRNSGDNFNGKPIGILIFDYKGDYNENHPDFIRMTNAKVYRPYHFPLNPFDLALGQFNKPALPLHVASAFTATIGKIYHLGDVQKQTLLDCIRQAYLTQGIRQDLPATWTRKAPTFQMVYDVYDQSVLKKGDSLGSAMKRLQDFQIFEANPMKTRSLFGLLDGVVVVDLSQYDPDIQNLIVAITLDLFYAQMKNQGSSLTDGRYRQISKMILVDEADNFMSEDFPALRKILKEGREFGVGTILSTQYLNHFVTGDDDYSSYIFTWIVHRVANLKNSNVEYVFGVKSKTVEHEQIYDSIKQLKKHESLIKTGENISQIEDFPFWILNKKS